MSLLDAWLDVLGQTILHSLWQGAVVVATLAVALRVLRSPYARYAASVAALAVLPLAAVLTFVHLWSPRLLLPSSIPAPAYLTEPATSPMTWIGLLWVSGVLVTGIRTARGWNQLRRLLSRCQEAPSSWQARTTELAREFQLHRHVRLMVSIESTTAFTVGVLRPVVVIPTCMLTGFPMAYAEAVLAHELAHIRRHDHLVNLIQRLVENIFFFHPAAWWIGRTIRLERECCADRLVVDQMIPPISYARALTFLEQTRAEPTQMLAAHGGNLMERIRRIFQTERPQRMSWSVLVGSLAIIALVAACAFALEQEDAEPQALSDESTQDASEVDPAPPSEARSGWSLPPQIEPYKPVFHRAACQHAIDPELLAAVAVAESNGVPTARSPIGAVGLMQILPQTAQAIADARGLETPTNAALEDPETSIDFAAWYLARQLDRFGTGRTEEEAIGLAAAAYNGGPERLERYLAGGGELTQETERYRHRVAQLWREFRTAGDDC